MSKKRILIIDKDIIPMCGAGLSLITELQKHEVYTDFSYPSDTIKERLEKMKFTYSIVLIGDVQEDLPLKPSEIVAKIKEFSDVLIVMITSSQEENKKGIEMGAICRLSKNDLAYDQVNAVSKILSFI